METAETNQTVEDSHADVEQQAEVNDFEFTESNNEGKQDQETNSANARRRREEQRNRELEKAKTEARTQAYIEALDGINPYTREAIKDEKDLQEYFLMREIAKGGGDPLSDYSKHHKQKEREAEAKVKEEADKKEWFKKDRDKFVDKYPDIDLNKLTEDKTFQKYADSQVGKKSIIDIYEGYIDLIGEVDKTSQARIKQVLANQKASVGSLASTENSNGYFTREQVKSMSREEVRRNFDKIQKSMKHWR